MEIEFSPKKIVIIVVLVLTVLLSAAFTPWGRGVWNRWFHKVQTVDDRTDYKTLKKVEDTCRSMIASYESDKAVFEQYKDSESPDKQEWADQAMMRANKTAATYNEYILKNSYVWEDNIPKDIRQSLEMLQRDSNEG